MSSCLYEWSDTVNIGGIDASSSLKENLTNLCASLSYCFMERCPAEMAALVYWTSKSQDHPNYVNALFFTSWQYKQETNEKKHW